MQALGDCALQTFQGQKAFILSLKSGMVWRRSRGKPAGMSMLKLEPTETIPTPPSALLPTLFFLACRLSFHIQAQTGGDILEGF